LNRLVQINRTMYLGERALFFAKQGDKGKALADFDEAVKLNPEIWLRRRAKFFESLGQTDNVLKDYQTLINILQQKVDEENGKTAKSRGYELSRAYLSRADFYERNNKLTEALADHQRAAAITSSYFGSYADFCEQHNFQDLYLEALNKLVSLNPEANLNRRAAFYESTNQPELAKADYNRLVKVSRKIGLKDGYSPLAWALQKRGAFYQRQGNNELSAADYKLSQHYEKLQKKFAGFSAWPSR
ncbi:MAG: hypothetical protein K5Q00_07315, partial [Gammaproteobacteria bacterium]|nr:hypothetical protein [Gammaproteobacteria bacterium]